MKPINIINKLNESDNIRPLDKEKYFNLMDAVDELIISVNGNKAQLQDVLKDVTEMFNKAINKLTESEYRYVTTHGTGPGTLPKDVNLIKSEDINSNGRVAIYVDRPLTKEELEKYDIRPEWIQESVTWDSITGSDQTAVEYFLGNFKNQCIDEEDFESNVRSSCNEIGWANEDLINQGYWDSSCGPKEDADPNYENVRDYLLTYHKDDIYKED